MQGKFNLFSRTIEPLFYDQYEFSLNNYILLKLNRWPLTREDAIKLIIDSLGPYDVTVGTTGQTSRELFEYR